MIQSLQPKQIALPFEDEIAVSGGESLPEDEWFTPPEFIILVREFFQSGYTSEAERQLNGRIDLDPASNQYANEVIRADLYYGKDETGGFRSVYLSGSEVGNGLNQEWVARHVYCNPPYSAGLIDRFVEKAIREYENCNAQEIIMLVNNRTETRWFQSLLAHATGCCLIKGRLKFWRPGVAPGAIRTGQVVFYLGQSERLQFFRDTFSRIGQCISMI
jgi:DNA N-6-adenine-methyltransferase (Dam)